MMQLSFVLFITIGVTTVFCATIQHKCPITNSTNIIYSIVNGVGPASKIWVEDLLWWWQQEGDSSIDYMAVSNLDLQACDLASFPNLKIYINPGGDAYEQLTDMGVDGRDHIISFVKRDQKISPSAYVGFCAGGYIAAHDYIWETMYEGPGYYNFEETPPLSIFPFSVEGSIVDINDDQYGDQSGSKFRLVNVSNGHQMLYYGGSTFGYSGTVDPTDPESSQYDPDVEVLVYYSDFYGYQTANIPAAWRYHNALMTSVHPEADNCTYSQDSDCPPENSVPVDQILQNRAWLCQYMNEAAQTSFRIPDVPVAPVFDTSRPHTHTPPALCYSEEAFRNEGVLLFCDGFDAAIGTVPAGLSPQFQRNQSDYNRAQPWNTSYISSWNEGRTYAKPHRGGGYAVAVPQASTSHVSTISTRAFSLEDCGESERPLAVSFYVQGQTVSSGFFSLRYQYLDAPQTDSPDPRSPLWQELYLSPLTAKENSSWEHKLQYISNVPGKFLQLQFACAAGVAADYFCAIDTLSVSC